MSGPPLFILLCSGEHEKVHMAAMTATVAAVSERPVQVFVSMNAVYAFEKGKAAADRYKGRAFSEEMKAKKAPNTLELFGQGRMLGDLKMHICAMALDVLGWDESNLVEDMFDGPMGLTKFLADAEEGQLVTM